MPRSRHCLNDTSNNKFTTFTTAGCEQYLKIMFTVFTTFKLVEQTIREWPETLRASANEKQNIKLDFHLPILDHLPVVNTENTKNPVTTHTKHCGCHNSPCELTILSCGSKPSPQREHDMLLNDIVTLKRGIN